MSKSILAALSKLDPSNDNHWTTDGLPRIDTVKLLAGDQSLTRDAITGALPGFSRTADQGLAKASADATPPGGNGSEGQVGEGSVQGNEGQADEGTGAGVEGASQGGDDGVTGDGSESTEGEQGEVASSGDSDLDSLRATLGAEQETLAQLVDEKNAVDKKVSIQQAYVDTLIEEIEATEKASGVNENSNAIQGYLASQQRNLASRAERLTKIRESGVDFKELTAGLKAPIDAARKTSK